MAMITCPNCGAELEEGATECPSCGCPVEEMNALDKPEKPQKVLSIKESDQCATYVLSWIYINVVQGLDNDYVNKMKMLLDKHSEMVNKCCIATIIGSSFGMPIGDFDLKEVVSVIKMKIIIAANTGMKKHIEMLLMIKNCRAKL